MRSKFLWTPILMAVCAIVGIIIGNISGKNKNVIPVVSPITNGIDKSYNDNKLQNVLSLISNEYVDKVDADSIAESLIPKVLEKLDPHSVYIPAKDLKRVNDDLKSDFGGIGIMFSLTDDTVSVVSVVAGGPSSLLGIMPGDKIVKVNGVDFVGDSITNEMVLEKLRGEIGTEVAIKIKRDEHYIDYTITRGEIPLSSVDVSYVIEPGIGYMRIDRFAERTYEEMLKGIAKLKADKCNTLIVDLRSNSGGLLDVVINMCNEFLAAGDLIVYTEGSHHPREEARANGLGTCQQMKVYVMIDEYSASASEIFAGAIQDNDRGVVIGRRSFGKGLVQTQIPLADNSAVRLTIARYHTPSGRCIQRSYDDGVSSYYDDWYKRYESGELFDADSVKFDNNQRFTTKKGRVVYGGGGIMPDYFIARDTTKVSDSFYKLRAKSIIYKYSLEYADKHRKDLSGYEENELVDKLLALDIMNDFSSYAKGKGVNVNKCAESEIDIISCEIKAYIGRNIKDNDIFYQIINTEDPAIARTLEIVKEQR